MWFTSIIFILSLREGWRPRTLPTIWSISTPTWSSSSSHTSSSSTLNWRDQRYVWMKWCEDKYPLHPLHFCFYRKMRLGTNVWRRTRKPVKRKKQKHWKPRLLHKIKITRHNHFILYHLFMYCVIYLSTYRGETKQWEYFRYHLYNDIRYLYYQL